MAKKTFPIKYTSRDFDSIKSDLIEYTQRYYSDTFKDFNEASFGALMLDTVSYVGDVLSFYLDYQTNECFIDTASEYSNVLRLGRQYGYKYRQNQVSYGDISLYIIVPSQSSGTGPDVDYYPILRKGSVFSSIGGGIFALNEDINFSKVTNEIVVAKVDPETGAPTSFAVKAKGKVISGEISEETITVGGFQKFLRLELASPNITEIVSVTDTEGNRYFEVDYLTQNIIYRSVSNRRSDEHQVPSIMKAYAVARRFVVEQEQNSTFLQFGHGSDSEIFNDSVADPSKILLKVHGKEYVTDTSFDPSNLIATDKFGIAPSNTKLVISYRTNTVSNSNASAHTINSVITPVFNFKDRAGLNSVTVQAVVDSLEVTNEERIVGDVSAPTMDEIKSRIKGTYAAQNRAVTKEDYKSVIYSMSSAFGSIKRCNIIQDNDSFKRNINIFIVSEDANKKLAYHTQTLEDNLKTWIGRYKMINDTIDIMPANIINLGIDFTIIGDMRINKYDVLSNVTKILSSNITAPNKTFDIGEPLIISDIVKLINNVPGVVDVIDINIYSPVGGSYSSISFNIEDSISADGRILVVPDDHIIEFKYPSSDIKGTIK